MKDEELIKSFKENYKLEEDCDIIYTGGSKQKNNISTGISIVIEGKEIGYSMSIDKRCSIFTAELLAIEKALGIALESGWEKDILILTDSQAACKDIQNKRWI